MLDLHEEARFLAAMDVTSKHIKNEIMQREIPEQEMRYFGANFEQRPNEEYTPLSRYSTEQLKKIEEILALREVGNEISAAIYFNKECEEMEMEIEKKNTLENTTSMLSKNIYEEIKDRLAACNSPAEYEAAYKWLTYQFIETNESAKRFENKFIEKYGEEAFGILIYGSEAEYKREKEFQEKLNNAKDVSKREAIFLQKLLTEPLKEEEEEVEIPDLWPEDDGFDDDYDYPQAQ